MARWKLATSHYLNTVKPAKWRYTHQDRATGENIEKEFIVPRMLDTNDPKCWTNRYTPIAQGYTDLTAEGEIVVCAPSKGQPGDIEFLGNPTPDMIPLDEEAEVISASFQDHWAYKPEAIPTNMSQAVVDRANFEPASVEIKGLDILLGSIASLIETNTKALEAVSHRRL